MNVVLLEEVLNHIHNWFVRDSSVFNDVQIENGELPYEIGAYVEGKSFYRIEGSYLNDGIHEVGGSDLRDEKIGRAKVSLLSIPRTLLLIVGEIEEWEKKYGEVSQGPFFSEEFGGYRYQIRGFSSYGVSGSPLSGWRLAFANRLNPFRKMY